MIVEQSLTRCAGGPLCTREPFISMCYAASLWRRATDLPKAAIKNPFHRQIPFDSKIIRNRTLL